MAAPAAAADRRAKEAYFTAGQFQLIWARFRRNRAAMAAASVLFALIAMGLTAPFLSPYDPTIAGRDKDYQNGAPEIPRFCDHNGCSWRPFLYTMERTRSIQTNFRWVTTVNTEKRRYVEFFVQGWQYEVLGLDIDMPGERFDLRIPASPSTATCSASTAAASIFSAPTRPARISSRAPCMPSGPRWPSAPSAC